MLSTTSSQDPQPAESTVVRDHGAHEHIAQDHLVRFYEHDAFLADAVAGFIAAAMREGEAGIIVATPEHQTAISARLRAAGLDVAALVQDEQLFVCDAAALLGHFLQDDQPDPARFRASVGTLIARASRGETRRVRIFGEMVDVLAMAGNMVAALQLEDLWAELQLSQPFALFCAYPLNRFAGVLGTTDLNAVCARHGRVLPTEQYTNLESENEQARTIALLQVQALALTAEIEARRRADERLRRQFLANPLPTFIWERTPVAGPESFDDYVLVEQNEAAVRFLGAASATSLGSRLSQIDAASSMGALPDLLACAETDQRVWREHSFITPETGQQRFIQMSLVAMPPELAIVFIEDVTERMEADQRKLQQSRGEKLRALGQLASGVAHDLNQYLTMITGYGELVRDAMQRNGTPGEIEDALDAILRAALDGGETVSQLLRFGRHQPDGVHEKVDVTALLQDVTRLTSPRWRDLAQLEGRPIRLELLVEGTNLEVLGHAPSLQEALTSLVFSAVDALPYGGEIRLSAERTDGQVVLTVADSGTRRSATGTIQRFEVRTHAEVSDSGRVSGGAESSSIFGLGLAQVWGIVERHGGTVDVQIPEQPEDTGTIIRLTLPSAPPAPAVVTRRVPTGNGPRLRLLVVDDEPALAQLAAQGLRRAGHHVEALHAATDALAKLDADPFDVLVTDLGLGDGMNGWELVRLARQKCDHLRVVMVSGWASDIEPALATANGVDAVVAKPYQLAALIRAVEGGAGSPTVRQAIGG